MLAKYEFDINWIAFPLHPETPEEGQSLVQLFGGDETRVAQIMDRLHRAAASLGLPLGQRTKTYNSRLAQELGKWAEGQGRGEEFHRAAFEAYFRDGRNIAQTGVLVDLAGQVGLDGQAALEVLETRSHKQAVDNDWAQSRQMGITAVPTIQAGFDRLTGMQPDSELEAFLKRAGARLR